MDLSKNIKERKLTFRFGEFTHTHKGIGNTSIRIQISYSFFLSVTADYIDV